MIILYRKFLQLVAATAVGFGALAMAPHPTTAATIGFPVFADLSTASISSDGPDQILSLTTLIGFGGLTVFNGDTLNITYSFLNGDRIKITDDGSSSPEFISLSGGIFSNTSFTSNSTIELTGLAGETVETNDSATGTSGDNIIPLGLFQLNATDTSFSFSGLSTSARIFFVGGQVDMTEIVLEIKAHRISVVGTSVIPLPAALPLFLTGLAGLGLMRRRKRQALRD